MLWQPRYYQPQGQYWRRPQTVAGGGGAPAYVYRSSTSGDPSGDTISFSVDIGTASSDRLVVVGACCQNAIALTSATAAGTGLTINIQRNVGLTAAIASGIVSSGSGSQTVSAVFTGSSFNTRALFVWTATGLASTTPKDTVSLSVTGDITVDAADLLFAVGMANATTNFTSSDETPDSQREITFAPFFFDAGDWVVNGTDANFTVAITAACVAANFA